MRIGAMFNALTSAISAISPRHSADGASVKPSIPSHLVDFTPRYDTMRTERSKFGAIRCTIRGYPSTGGYWMKQADILDMLYLSVPRSHPVQRSDDASVEDAFCDRVRRIGATWWASEQESQDVLAGVRQATEAETKVLVFGWPSDGSGVWVLRYASENEVPEDFGMVRMALDMDEKIEAMRKFGAEFIAEVSEVEELSDSFPLKARSDELSQLN